MAEAEAEAQVARAPTREELAEMRRQVLAHHPHTRLRGILSDLASPAARASDIATKHAMLHAAVTRLAQTILSHTPPPEDDDGEALDGSK